MPTFRCSGENWEFWIGPPTNNTAPQRSLIGIGALKISCFGDKFGLARAYLPEPQLVDLLSLCNSHYQAQKPPDSKITSAEANLRDRQSLAVMRIYRY